MSPSYQVRARQRRQKVLIQSCCATVAPIDGFQSGPALRLHAFDIPTPGSRSEPPTPLTQRVPPVCCHLPWFTGVCILLSRTWRPRLLLRPWDMLRYCVRKAESQRQIMSVSGADAENVHLRRIDHLGLRNSAFNSIISLCCRQ
jgi:hypothetical protein